MKNRVPTVPARGSVSIATADAETKPSSGRSVATRDHDIIRRWAARHRAEPATGEATASGPATVHINDGGPGVRFNFPGAPRFRPISWEEWFENFDRYRLVFVYDEEVAERAYELWRGHGSEHGRDQEDWFEAERQLQDRAVRPTPQYRFVTESREEND
jgi:hypothetical protein